MSRLDRALLRFVRILGLAGGWTLLLLAMSIVVSSLGRKYFAISIQGIDEIGGYVLAVVGAAGFSLTFLERAHIRIEIVRSRLPHGGQALLDLLALSTMIFTALVLFWLGLMVVEQSVSMGAVAATTLRTPLVYPQSLWVAALGLFLFVTVYVALRCVPAVLRRDWDFVRRRLGSEDVADEVARELEDARRRSADQGADR
ncbi:MAG: TRAP transporter small permease subunit [Lautropia sp.]